MKKSTLFVLSLGLVWNSHAQLYLANGDAMNDLYFLVEQIKTYNPGLDKYNPTFEADVQKVFDTSPTGEIGPFEYFSLVSQICALSNESHFGLGDWKDTIHSGFLASRYRYQPLSVYIIKDQLFVHRDLSNERQLKPGDEIITINGEPVIRIIERLREVTCSDGQIRTQQTAYIESGWSWRYYLYIDRPEQFLYEVKTVDGIFTEYPVEALSREQQVMNVKLYYDQDQSDDTEKGFADFKVNDQYAILTMPSFDRSHIENNEVKSTKFYKTIFSQLKESGTQNLIIDLRNNSGGRFEFAEDILPYILKDDQGHTFMKKSLSWEGKERTHKLPKSSKLLFQGNIYVLVNGKTFSSAATLSRFLKEYADATIIGEETASRYEGYVAGSKQYIMLPASEVVIKIPRYLNEYPQSTKQQTFNRGLMPDHIIHYSFQERFENIDKHMAKAKDLIEP